MKPHGPASGECRELFAQLSLYLDGDLDADLCAGVEEHLHDCPPCQAFLESLRRTVGLVRDLPTSELPEEIGRDVAEAYRKMLQEREKGD